MEAGTTPMTAAAAQEPVQRWRELTVIAQDPRLRDRDRKIVTSKVRVPYERLEPGPRGHRFHVVDYDATTETYHRPTQLAKQDGAPDDPTSDRARWFRAQNVYAIAARTLAT